MHRHLTRVLAGLLACFFVFGTLLQPVQAAPDPAVSVSPLTTPVALPEAKGVVARELMRSNKIGRIAWGYYVTDDPLSLQSLRDNIGNLDVVAMHWLATDANGNTRGAKEDLNLVRWAQSQGVKVFASVNSGGGPDVPHAFLSDPVKRDRAVKGLVDAVVLKGYDGIHLDYEGLAAADRPLYTDFVKRVSAAMHAQGKFMTIALPAKDNDAPTSVWAGAFDFKALAPSVDLAVIMAYGWKTGKSVTPGSVAPISWVDRCMSYTVQQMGAEKVILGVPLYGYDWNVTKGPPGVVRSYAQFLDVARQYNAPLEYLQRDQAAFYRYLDANGDNHQVWVENATTLSAKLDLIDQYDLAGAAAWRLGHEDPDVWSVINGKLSARTWLLAEGSTQGSFNTWLLLQNPQNSVANATVTWMLESGQQVVRQYKLPPQSRTNIWVNQVVPNAALATRVDADQSIFVERAMYIRSDGHASAALPSGSARWYLPEGYTGPGYDTWILMLNPNQTPVNVKVTFMLDSGAPVVRNYVIKPTARFNLWANSVVPNSAFATQIEADANIVAERATYFGGGSTGSTGLTFPAQRWYLAEGYTGPGYMTFILVQNPNPAAAQVGLTFLLQNGQTVRKTYTMQPTSRLTVRVNDFLPNQAMATVIDSDRPVLAERAMYFKGGIGGHSSTATNRASTIWYLPEGSTAGQFSTFILIMNPNSQSATAQVTFMTEDGRTVTRSIQMPPTSRTTIDVGTIVPNAALSTRVQSSLPVVVERAMYFQNGAGGTDAMGIAP